MDIGLAAAGAPERAVAVGADVEMPGVVFAGDRSASSSVPQNNKTYFTPVTSSMAGPDQLLTSMTIGDSTDSTSSPGIATAPRTAGQPSSPQTTAATVCPRSRTSSLAGARGFLQ